MQSINDNFIDSSRQFSFLEISLVYKKCDQHNTIYDIYDVEIVSTKIQSLKVESASNTYGLTCEIEYDIYDEDDKYWLYAQLLAFNDV